MSPQIMPSDADHGPIAPTMRRRSRRMPGCATTSGCSAASSATPCASRKATRCSSWSSASARPRSASIATTTAARGASSKPSSTACRPARPSHRARLQLFLAPRQYRRGPAPHPPQARASAAGGAPRAGSLAHTLAHARGRRLQRRRPAAVLRRRAGQPGADRPSDRSAAQEHDGSRDGDRGAARPARARATHAGRGRGERRAVAPGGADAVADQSAAPDQAHGARRGRQRPFVLRLHFPARGAAAALRAGRPAERGRERRPANWRRSCGWAAGSAATATAIRSSPPT